MIFSIISQQYIFRKTFIADLDFIQNRNNKFLSSIMLLFAFVLFSFQGAKLRKLFRGEAASEVFFAYFLVHKKVSGGLERTRTSDLTLIRRAL